MREIGGRARIGEASGIHQQDLRAALGLIEIGGAPNDGHALGRQRTHHPPQLAPRDGIHADGGFVEQQQARAAQQHAGEAELLLHAAGELAGGTRGETGKIREIEQSLEGGAPWRADHVAQVGVQIEVLQHRQILVEAEFLRHVAERPAQRVALRQRIETGHAERSGGRLEKARHQSHQRGLAGAVRSDESGHLTGRHQGGDAVDRVRRGAGEAVSDSLQFGREIHGWRPAAAESGASLTVTGMPWRRAGSGSSTTMRARKTSAVRSSGVSTVFGVNSAVVETKPTWP